MNNTPDNKLSNKYAAALKEVLINLRAVEMPNEADSYIDDSIKIILAVLKES